MHLKNNCHQFIKLRFWNGGSLVQRGMAWYENWKKAEQVQFNTIFQILKKYLADGMQVHEFMLDLMAMITTVSEDEWGTWKDPSKLKQKE